MARVLIIDDDVDLVQIMTMALKAAGHEVLSAGNPAAGMDAARAFKPDIILLDYHMPGQTGAHLFESLRRNNATAEIPILFMSGEASPEKVFGEIVESGRSRFIAKPVHMTDLQRIIGEMLRS